MKRKTEVYAQNDRQDLIVEREFDIPLSHLFQAYVDPHIVEQWMNTHVLALDCQQYGHYRFLTRAPGGTELSMTGVFHSVIKEQRVVRTFEMEGMNLGVQLEILNYATLGDSSSKLIKHIVYESVAQRDQHLKMPFRKGINMAHNRLEDIVSSIND